MRELPSRREKPIDTTLHIDERVIFRPFRNASEFLKVDLDKAYEQDEIVSVLKQDIEFKGIKGAIIIYANPDPEEENPLTPLGDAHLTTTFSNESSRITEAPCYLAIEFTATNQEQFDTLENYQAQIYLNDEVFYLDCDAGTDSEYAFHEFRKGNHVLVEADDLEDKDREIVEILLPQNVNILSSIRMRITEYDDDDDSSNEEDTSPSPLPESISIP